MLICPRMHRRRVKLSSRTERLTERIGRGSVLVRGARSIEHRGVVATYDVHEHLLRNPRARRRFGRAGSPALDDVQERVLDELRRNDYAIVPFSDLFPDADLRQRVELEGAAFKDSVEGRLARGKSPATGYKDYLVRAHTRGDELDPTSPWFSCCLSERLLDVANAYLGMWSKLEYVDLWYATPVDADSERVQSQRWHRDFDDRHLLKAFLYLVDVDEETGPLEFVAGSARGGAAADFIPWRPASEKYPSQEEFDQHVSADKVRTFTAPAGTVILCNTSGFHRGGFATGKSRVLATATYCSPASLASLTENNYTVSDEARSRLSGAALFATPDALRRGATATIVNVGRTVLVAAFLLAFIFVVLPEALHDHPYNVF